jgi:hypothetical protein
MTSGPSSWTTSAAVSRTPRRTGKPSSGRRRCGTQTNVVAAPTKARKGWIRSLAKRAENADAYLKHQLSVKSFVAADALSVITESTAYNSDGDESDDAYHKAKKEVWSKAAAREAKHTKTKALGTAGIARGNSLGKAKRVERTTKRASGAASSSMIVT